MEPFASWLETELNRRQISAAELSRRSGIPKATISRILSGHRRAGEGAILRIARGLQLPPELVFRAAGILPQEPKSDAMTEEGLHILHKLDGEDKVEALRYLRLRLEVAEDRKRQHGRRARGAAHT